MTISLSSYLPPLKQFVKHPFTVVSIRECLHWGESLVSFDCKVSAVNFLQVKYDWWKKFK
uniref:Uncharacterized protein n=1 Tax=Arion vulgaris TaxID=1028688 RepID=A0A0B7BK30_9EUPU